MRKAGRRERKYFLLSRLLIMTIWYLVTKRSAQPITKNIQGGTLVMNQKVIFLSKENQPSRISAKTFAAYKRAKREHLSANENYNRQVFGIDSLTYKWVQVAVQHVVGLCEDLEKLADINSWFANPGYRTDDEGRYLSYLGHTVSVRSC
jgi:hypothetical protein